jgi:hypothetical protein
LPDQERAAEVLFAALAEEGEDEELAAGGAPDLATTPVRQR